MQSETSALSESALDRPAASEAASEPAAATAAPSDHLVDPGYDEVALVETLTAAIDLNLASRDVLRQCASQMSDLTLAANFRNISGQRQRQAQELLQYVPDALGPDGTDAEDGRFVAVRAELLEGENPQAITDIIGVLMRTEARFQETCRKAVEAAGTHGIASVLARHLRNAQTVVSRINGLRTAVEA